MKRMAVAVMCLALAGAVSGVARGQDIEPWQVELYDNWKNLPEPPELYESHRPHAEALDYAAKKAGVTRPVALMLGDKLPMNLEVLPRVDGKGRLMVIVISHDKTEATYNVTVAPDYVKRGMQAWNMLTEKVIEKNTDGRFKMKVPSWGVSVFMIGADKDLESIKGVQAGLSKKDISVPKYFLDRPELNEAEWSTPIPPIGE